MLGQGCPICAGRYMDTKLFIERSTEVHNGKYDYSLVDYKGATEKVKIICPRHGIFEQVASSHLIYGVMAARSATRATSKTT